MANRWSAIKENILIKKKNILVYKVLTEYSIEEICWKLSDHVCNPDLCKWVKPIHTKSGINGPDNFDNISQTKASF